MAWSECDGCKGSTYTPDNPFVEFRQRRPSVPSEMTCTLAGHQKCINAPEVLPAIGMSGGCATPDQWAKWIETPEALAAGYTHLG